MNVEKKITKGSPEGDDGYDKVDDGQETPIQRQMTANSQIDRKRTKSFNKSTTFARNYSIGRNLSMQTAHNLLDKADET